MAHEGLKGWNREGPEGVIPFITTDVVLHPFPEWPGPTLYRGHDGFRRLAAEWTDTFDGYSWTGGKVIDAGDQVVLLVFHEGTIKETDVPVSQPIGSVWGDVQDGRFGEVWFFLKWQEALKAAGLSE